MILLFLMALLSVTSCIEFNLCKDNFGPIVGYLATDLSVTESCTRGRECAMGNLVADALLESAAKKCGERPNEFSCPDMALVHGGGIRKETSCGYREQLKAGAIYRSNIEQLLPFGDQLIVVNLTGDDIKLALEHAVSDLGPPFYPLTSHFLHVAGLSFTVDCDKTPHRLASNGLGIAKKGDRVSEIFLTGAPMPTPLDLNAVYAVAMPSYLAQGNDGFLAFLQRDHLDHVVEDFGGQTLTKFNQKKDLVFNLNNKPLSYTQALIDYLTMRHAKNIHVSEPLDGRISMMPNCFGLSKNEL